MMILYRLVRLIETHSDALAASLLNRVHNSRATPAYINVPPEELKERVAEIYRHLGEWIMYKNEVELEKRYRTIGAQRAKQNVPFSQLAWAIILTKDNLWAFLKTESIADRPLESLGELEILQLLDHFFDRAIYYAGLGYEKELADQAFEARGFARVA